MEASSDAIGERSRCTDQAPPSQGGRSWSAQGLHSRGCLNFLCLVYSAHPDNSADILSTNYSYSDQPLFCHPNLMEYVFPNHELFVDDDIIHWKVSKKQFGRELVIHLICHRDK